MSGSLNAPYTIGRNCQVVLLWQGSRIDMPNVTEFRANQEIKTQRVDPLTSLPTEFNTPSGWRGSFMVDRASPVIDDLIAGIEAAFWSAGTIGSGTIYQYVTNPDRSLSSYEFTNVSLVLSDAGQFQAENVVRQTLGFFASFRTKLT